jgi:hypothetical protein
MRLSRSTPPTTPADSARSIAPGLYWIKQHCPQKGIDHHAILDVGNRTGSAREIDRRDPTLIHQTPPWITREPARGTGQWNVVQKVADEADAIVRLRVACTNPLYRLFDNNCEHFARYIATGVRESHQLQVASFVAAMVGLAWAAAR